MKLICPMCGTDFDTEQGKCPNCGSQLDTLLDVLRKQRRSQELIGLSTREIEDLFEFEASGSGYAVREYLGLENRVYIPSRYKGRSVNAIAPNAFEGADIEEVIMPISIREIGTNAFNGCFKLKSVTISERCREVGNHAFCDCTSLETLFIPDSVKEIGNHAFSGCISLKRIKLPKALEYIGEYLFENCKSLECLSLPESVKNIGSYAFLNCYGLKKFKFNEGLMSIGDFAFSGCLGIKKVLLPESLVKIGNDAFYEAKGLTHLYIGENLTELSGRSFYGADNLGRFKVNPANKTYRTDGNCILDIGNVLVLGTPHTVISTDAVGIQSWAFCGYTFNEPLFIPNSIIRIERESFLNNKKLCVLCEAQERPIRWEYDWLVGEGDVFWGKGV